jgi:membrane fusion protein (multidrug efflux system)
MSAQSTPILNVNETAAKSARPQPPWYRTAKTRNVIIGLLVIIVLGTLGWWVFLRPYVSTDDARIAMTLVRVAPSGVSGRIETLNVAEGSRVKKGDVMVEIDHRIPQANYDKAKAKADLATRDYNRMQHLASEGSATPQQLDQSRAASATADLEMKQAEVALENTYLKAPFDGIVIQKLAEVGNLLEPSQTAVVVADDVHAWVAANIEETSVGDVAIGQPVKISVDEGGTLEGKVIEIRSSVASQFALIPSDMGAGNYTKVVQRVPIKVEIIDAKGRTLRAGQSVEIKIRVH